MGILLSILYFRGCVPRYFIFDFFRGMHPHIHHLLLLQHTPLCPKRTPLFHFCHFSGYTLPPTTHKSILWRRFAPEYAFFSFSFVSNSVTLTGIISRSTTYSIIFFFRFRYYFTNLKHISLTTCHTPSPTGSTSPPLLAIHLRRYQRHQWHGQHYA